MRPLNLEEFAQQLRLEGHPFANEILELANVQEEVADPFFDLCEELNHHASDTLKDKPEKMVEWLIDRSDLLTEIEEELKKAGHDGDADDSVREILGTLKAGEEILEEHGWPGTNFLDALEKLAEATPTPMEYDL